MTTSAFRMGNDSALKSTVFIGACPGANEGKEQRPFSANGRAGKSLRVLLQVLNNTYPMEFGSVHLDDYTLLNAHTTVRATGVPTKKQIEEPSNLARLRKLFDLVKVQRVVVLGSRAGLALSSANLGYHELRFPHPTSRKVNSPKKGSWEGNWEYWTKIGATK